MRVQSLFMIACAAFVTADGENITRDKNGTALVAPFFENPATGCQGNEVVYRADGLSGSFCAPPCEGPIGGPYCTSYALPPGTDAKPSCIFGPMLGKSVFPKGWRCALQCLSSTTCPKGSTCQKWNGHTMLKFCTY